MAKRHFLMLAHKYTHGLPIGGWYVSEKLDGMRAFWDGGVTRGMDCRSVPFANVEKDARYIIAPKSTGLWSRYGKPIQAPDWFLDNLPEYPLDGELYCGRQNFQLLMSTVKDLIPGPGWKNVSYRVFDIPAPHVVFSDGEINETNFKKKFVSIIHKIGRIKYPFTGTPTFERMIDWAVPNIRGAVVHDQIKLTIKSADAHTQVMAILEAVIDKGGEGLILRAPTSYWLPHRVKTLLKVKALNDAEAMVVGYTWGRETDLGSKLLGKMGALIVQYNGKRFELSGFTDEEREMVYSDSGLSAYSEGCLHPGQQVAEGFHNPAFPKGSVITFRYRELTNDGIPKEARYWRKFE